MSTNGAKSVGDNRTKTVGNNSRKNSRPSSRNSQHAPISHSPEAYDLLTQKRQEKAEAIQKCEYKKSAQIQREIDAILSQDRNTTVDDRKEILKQTVLTALGNFESNLIDIQDASRATEEDIRTAISESFANLQSHHQAELAGIEFKRLKAVDREEHRETGDFKFARAKSQRLATEDQPEEADAIYREAKAQLDQQRQLVLASIEEKFEKRVARATRKHATDFANLEADLDAQLASAETKKEEEIESQRKAVKVTIQSALQSAIAACAKDVSKKALLGKLISELTQFVKDLLKQEGKSEFL
jgi:hypothetical protein